MKEGPSFVSRCLHLLWATYNNNSDVGNVCPDPGCLSLVGSFARLANQPWNALKRLFSTRLPQTLRMKHPITVTHKEIREHFHTQEERPEVFISKPSRFPQFLCLFHRMSMLTLLQWQIIKRQRSENNVNLLPKLPQPVTSDNYCHFTAQLHTTELLENNFTCSPL